MGLFTDQKPTVQSLRLQSETFCYRPGDRIRGTATVTFRSKVDHISDISVGLYGVAGAHLTSASYSSRNQNQTSDDSVMSTVCTERPPNAGADPKIQELWSLPPITTSLKRKVANGDSVAVFPNSKVTCNKGEVWEVDFNFTLVGEHESLDIPSTVYVWNKNDPQTYAMVEYYMFVSVQRPQKYLRYGTRFPIRVASKRHTIPLGLPCPCSPFDSQSPSANVPSINSLGLRLHLTLCVVRKPVLTPGTACDFKVFLLSDTQGTGKLTLKSLTIDWRTCITATGCDIFLGDTNRTEPPSYIYPQGRTYAPFKDNRLSILYCGTRGDKRHGIVVDLADLKDVYDLRHDLVQNNTEHTVKKYGMDVTHVFPESSFKVPEEVAASFTTSKFSLSHHLLFGLTYYDSSDNADKRWICSSTVGIQDSRV